MKKILISIITATLLFSGNVFAIEEEVSLLIAPAPIANEVIDEPIIMVENEKVDLKQFNLTKYLYEENGNTMVPVRAVAEKMGYVVDWDGENRIITVGNEKWQAVVTIDKDSYYGVSKIAIGMTAPMSYGAKAVIIEDRTFVPAKMFELMGYDYIVEGKSINFTKENINQVANPFIEYETSEELNKNMGFSIKENLNLEEKSQQVVYIASNFGLSQIAYKINGDKEIRFRQSREKGDISGDYTGYTDIKTLDSKITLKGFDGKYNLAIWEDGEFSYSLHNDEALTKEAMLDMIDSFK